jgi:CelD/BcsL family acetyltransferase involved in cellulose biosynthesis
LSSTRCAGSEAVEATRAPCVIETIRDRAGFNALEAEWNALFHRAGRPDQLFQSFNWLWHWANHYLDDERTLRLVVGWRDGRLVMVWPLLATRRFGLETLVWMGAPVAQYGDALAEPESDDCLAAGWRALQALGADLALLRKTRETSVAGTYLIGRARRCDHAAAPFLAFRPGAPFDAAARQNAKARSSRRRLLRRLQETGEIRFSAPDAPADAAALVRRAFALKRAWLIDRGRYSGAVENEAMQRFFLDATTSTSRPVGAFIDYIEKDGAAVAIAISFAAGGVGLGHIIARDPQFDKQGAGALLIEHVLKCAAARGLARFDMLAPQDAYKMEWASGAEPVADYLIAFSGRGRLFCALWASRARERLLQAIKRLPPQFGRVLWPLLRRLKQR